MSLIDKTGRSGAPAHGRSGHVADTLCSWGKCLATTDGHPICEQHLREAWAIIQIELYGEDAAINTPSPPDSRESTARAYPLQQASGISHAQDQRHA